jgi:hypothetical protein
MRTRVPLNVSGLTPELRAAAERAAGKMGLSLEDWMRLMASETGENYGADRERRDQGYDAGGGYQRSEALATHAFPVTACAKACSLHHGASRAYHAMPMVRQR